MANFMIQNRKNRRSSYPQRAIAENEKARAGRAFKGKTDADQSSLLMMPKICNRLMNRLYIDTYRLMVAMM